MGANAASLGLSAGSTYEFHVFHCQMEVSLGAHFKLTTSLALAAGIGFGSYDTTFSGTTIPLNSYGTLGSNLMGCPYSTAMPSFEECEAIAAHIVPCSDYPSDTDLCPAQWKELRNLLKTAFIVDYEFGADAMFAHSDTKNSPLLTVDSTTYPKGCYMLAETDDAQHGRIVFNTNANGGPNLGATNICQYYVIRFMGDPHFSTPNGDKFDFKGADNAYYTLLSAASLSVRASSAPCARTDRPTQLSTAHVCTVRFFDSALALARRSMPSSNTLISGSAGTPFSSPSSSHLPLQRRSAQKHALCMAPL